MALLKVPPAAKARVPPALNAPPSARNGPLIALIHPPELLAVLDAAGVALRCQSLPACNHVRRLCCSRSLGHHGISGCRQRGHLSSLRHPMPARELACEVAPPNMSSPILELLSPPPNENRPSLDSAEVSLS